MTHADMDTLPPGPCAHAWSHEEKRFLAQAAKRAPHFRLNGEWTLKIHDGRVELFERLDELRGRRARLIACGAALANLEVAMRMLGWIPRSVVTGNADSVAAVVAAGRTRATPDDVARYGAMFDRTTRPAEGAPVQALPPEAVEDMCAVARRTGVGVLTLAPGQELVLPKVGARIGRHCLRPENAVLARSSYLVTTATEARHELVLAGRMSRYLRLGAVEHGLNSSTLTEPFDTPQVRAALAGSLGVRGFPQLLVSMGRPLSA